MFRNKPVVFVSYSRRDSDQVKELTSYLERCGVRPWLDTRDIVAGEWQRDVDRGLRRSNFFIACLSRNTGHPGEVRQYELNSALEIQKKRLEGDVYLIPVRLEECELPEELRPYQCFDFFEEYGRAGLRRALRTKARQNGVFAAAIIAALLITGGAGAYFCTRAGAETELPAVRIQGKSARDSRRAQIGVHMWRMERPQPSDPPSVREIVQPAATTSLENEGEWTPVRLPPDVPFRLGDRFEVGIETNRTGYVYVMNRSVLRNGSTLEGAKVIFPTNRIHSGDNHIWPGRMIRLPDRNSNPPFWEFRSNDPEYGGEQLIVLITPHPIEGLGSQDDAVPLAPSAVAEWAKRYGQDVRLDVRERIGGRLTAEEAAGRDGDSPLSLAAPLPQYTFSADRDRSSPILAILHIRVVR